MKSLTQILANQNVAIAKMAERGVIKILRDERPSCEVAHKIMPLKSKVTQMRKRAEILSNGISLAGIPVEEQPLANLQREKGIKRFG